jgi:hypothetical protein
LLEQIFVRTNVCYNKFLSGQIFVRTILLLPIFVRTHFC